MIPPAFPCGTKVITKVGEIDGIITAIQNRFGRLTYEISYPCAGEIKTTWLIEEELTTIEKTENKIAF